uniref:limb region 1 homolog-like protein n=1 Tax=Oncorhynchus gorbuscha TaxID=8017 RepID=UPI001EAF628A|nr:limb region 1 homolog-like protein [Oncorhynchus gorbuscha]
MEAPEDVSVRDQLSHDRVRETIICVLLFICLYIISYLVIIHCNRNAEFTTGTCESVRPKVRGVEVRSRHRLQGLLGFCSSVLY